MKQPSVYLKMRILGAIDTAPGRTRHERIHDVAAMTFLDEDGNPRQFTWRTIQIWHYRYKNHGITSMTTRSRKDKGQARKVTPEELLEAINAATPHFHDQRTKKRVSGFVFPPLFLCFPWLAFGTHGGCGPNATTVRACGFRHRKGPHSLPAPATLSVLLPSALR